MDRLDRTVTSPSVAGGCSLASTPRFSWTYGALSRVFFPTSRISWAQLPQPHLPSLPPQSQCGPEPPLLCTLSHLEPFCVSFPSPSLSITPVRWAGSIVFLFQCSLVFDLQPATYPTVKAKITFIVNLLSGGLLPLLVTRLRTNLIMFLST